MQYRWIIGIIAACLLMTSSVVHAATLEIPGPHATVSGIGVISGWKCAAGELTVRFDGGAPLPLLHGAERADVLNARACDHAHVGFLSIMNWGELAAGEHTAVVYDFWNVAQGDILNVRMHDTDPANLQPSVRPFNHRMAEFIRRHPPLDVSEGRVNRSLDILESPWPRREELMLRGWFESSEYRGSELASFLVDQTALPSLRSQ